LKLAHINSSSDSNPVDSQLLEQRRQQALMIAQECAHILKQEFGATEVIIFGSLRGDAPWHWRSDLDLAVRGMSEPAIWEAYSKIEKVVPSWLRFDLVSVDDVSPQLRTRILQEKAMPQNKYLALKARLDDEIIAIERNIEALTTVLTQVETVPEVFVTPTLASYIADFYTGCEHLSERVAVTLDGGLPKGDNWHELLLRQVAEVGGEDRPPLWAGSLLLELDEYRKFRHLVRHTYNVQLKPERVLALAQNVQPVFAKIQGAIAFFSEWLVGQQA
jgi:predicted nucleotidyltransferase